MSCWGMETSDKCLFVNLFLPGKSNLLEIPPLTFLTFVIQESKTSPPKIISEFYFVQHKLPTKCQFAHSLKRIWEKKPEMKNL